MSGLAINVELTGFEAIEAFLARLNPIDHENLLEGLARFIRESVRERIISGGPAPDGAAWKPNREGRAPILHRSGALARSIDYAVSGMQAVVGSGLIYAAIHQFGGVITAKSARALMFRIGNQFVMVKSVTMPARPYIGLSADDRSELLAIAVAFIRKKLG